MYNELHPHLNMLFFFPQEDLLKQRNLQKYAGTMATGVRKHIYKKKKKNKNKFTSEQEKK